MLLLPLLLPFPALRSAGTTSLVSAPSGPMVCDPRDWIVRSSSPGVEVSVLSVLDGQRLRGVRVPGPAAGGAVKVTRGANRMPPDGPIAWLVRWRLRPSGCRPLTRSLLFPPWDAQASVARGKVVVLQSGGSEICEADVTEGAELSCVPLSQARTSPSCCSASLPPSPASPREL